jgi:hypothetical protein
LTPWSAHGHTPGGRVARDKSEFRRVANVETVREFEKIVRGRSALAARKKGAYLHTTLIAVRV